MESNEILKEVNKIFIDTLDNPEILLTNETTANDVDEWDSLSHIYLMVEIEKYYKIRFTAKEIQSFKNVGELCDCIIEKLATMQKK
jgi:acyl carrier protein